MRLKLRYFAWVRERIGRAEEDVELPAEVATVSGLIDWLIARGPEYAHAFERRTVIRVAIDQLHQRGDVALGSAREVAFFPPVTGG